jgi:hypothetical protein
MSNGDEEPDAEKTEAAEGSGEPPEPADPEPFAERLDDAADAVDRAETEDDLDRVEATLDEIEADLEDAVFAVEIEDEPEEAEEDEPDEAEEDEDEAEESEEANPRDEFEDRLDDLRADVEDQRGPYRQDVTDALDDAVSTIEDSEWTKEGADSVVDAVGKYVERAGDTLEETFAYDAETPADAAMALASVKDAVNETPLDPDDDAGTIDALLVAAENLSSDLDDAQVWSDLEVREQLRREGFYDVLDPETRKDFPPEWSAIKLYEKAGEFEPILSAMEKLDSDFMEDNILDSIEHEAPTAAYEPVHALAQRRNKQPVRILGRIADERACDTLADFLGGGDVALEQVSLRALGAIGSEESTEPVAQRLAADDPSIRSAAARALGMIGDTRAIEPLGDVLDEDEDDSVRASAAWALTQIGTQKALETAAKHADDRSYIVQVEAEKAAGV